MQLIGNQKICCQDPYRVEEPDLGVRVPGAVVGVGVEGVAEEVLEGDGLGPAPAPAPAPAQHPAPALQGGVSPDEGLRHGLDMVPAEED